MNAQGNSSIISLIDEPISAGLSHDEYETMQLSTAFWESVWPKLEEYGWEKKVRYMYQALYHQYIRS